MARIGQNSSPSWAYIRNTGLWSSTEVSQLSRYILNGGTSTLPCMSSLSSIQPLRRTRLAAIMSYNVLLRLRHVQLRRTIVPW